MHGRESHELLTFGSNSLCVPRKIIIIGAGFAGMSAAAFMAKAGWEVQVLEKHPIPGGRARQMTAAGFTFDMGPSWYWMPDIFERFFASFGKKVSDYYELVRLDPSYRIYWGDGPMDIPASYDALKALFESLEPGAGERLDHFMTEAAFKYKVGINKLVYKPGQSLSEFLDRDLIQGLFRLDVFNSIKSHVHKHFKHPKIRQLMEFPVLFLGALPEDTPALYSLMNYADIKLGTWFPKGGMYEIVKAMHSLAEEQGARFHFSQDVKEIQIHSAAAKRVVTTDGKVYEADVVIGGADYHFIESKLLAPEYRTYTDAWWDKKVMAPGCLIYYVGLNTRIPGLHHHSLFFDVPFDQHARDIYTTKQWPEQPLFYLSATSVTDPTQAPPGGENLFFLIPLAAGLKGDTEEMRERYFQIMADRLQQQTGMDIRPQIVYKKSFAHADFLNQYNAFKGNAYGLANTLMQTAILKPSCRSRKVKNLFYTGQLTVPGPGVPPSLISGEVVAGQVVKHFS
jgi:phytoene desaturase